MKTIQTDFVEFYTGSWLNLLARMQTSIVPERGEYISIQGCTWKVIRRAYAIDNLDSPVAERQMVANIMLAPHLGKENDDE